MKKSFRIKISLLCLAVIVSAIGITFTVKKVAHDNYIKAFMQISVGMSRNMNQLRNTQGIMVTGLAADPSKKEFKIGVTMDKEKITPDQLKEAMEAYLVNSLALISNQDWKILMKPYNIQIEDFASEKVIGEKPIDFTEIIWSSFSIK